MAVHDAACVPFPGVGRSGADPYPAPAPAGTGPERRVCLRGMRSVTGRRRSGEGVRALLEIQVRPRERGEAASILPWRPRRRAPSREGSAREGGTLDRVPEGPA